jgi:ankyrin repeat protein
VTRAALAILLAGAAAAAAQDDLGDRFERAISRGSLREVKELVEDVGAPVDTPIKYGDHTTTPLIKAADAKRPEIVGYLLEKGAKVNARATADGGTALLAAVMRGDEDSVSRLLAAGADVKIKDARGNSPFMIAAAGARIEIADLLLAKGADPNEADQHGITPLSAAATMGGEEALRYLVKAGANVNKVTQLEYGGSTALTTAAAVGNVANVKVLLELGADPRLKMKDGRTALINAEASGNAETVALIKAALAKAPAKPAAKPKR